MKDKLQTFSKFGATGNGGITRLCFTEPNLQARAEFSRRCRELGMELKTDDMGNIYATLKGSENLPSIAVGSHVDSVIRGGNYDGILGVLTALEAAETLVSEGIKTRHPVTVLVWTNEEGSRFRPAMMSSGVITGKFDRESMLAVKDDDGITFEEALNNSGYKGDTSNRFSSENYRALLELHIEQGPVLEAENKDIGLVLGVLGMVNYEIITRGQANHAGTTPMPVRKDALHAMTEIIRHLHHELDKLDPDLVYTTGEFGGSPNIHTVIPDYVRITLDARHKDPRVIEQVVNVVENLPTEILRCKVSFREQWSRHTVEFNPDLINIMEESIKKLGYPYKKMYSGAGHDAQYIADVVPSTMVFVPSKEGFSHCEEEYTPLEQCWKGANVILHTLLALDKK
jgi:N-carbamoyl-L-amino-acid hydrolase